MAYRVSRERFMRLAEEALGNVPEEFREHFTNITVLVEDMPSHEDAESTGVPRSELLGLFSGRPIHEQGGFFDSVPHLPEEIVLFQRNIEKICSSEDELIEEIRKTVVHEVGHYFGFSEEELGEFE